MDKKQIINEFNRSNNSDIFCLIITTYKTNHYSYDNLMKKLKISLKKNEIRNKDFDFVAYLDHIRGNIEDIMRDDGVDEVVSYLDFLIVKFDNNIDFLAIFI